MSLAIDQSPGLGRSHGCRALIGVLETHKTARLTMNRKSDAARGLAILDHSKSPQAVNLHIQINPDTLQVKNVFMGYEAGTRVECKLCESKEVHLSHIRKDWLIMVALWLKKKRNE